MADTTTSSGGNCVEQMKSYVRTQKGTILAAEILISFIIIICYAASAYAGISTLAICEMIFAIVFFVIFMMGLDKQFKLVNWMWSVSLGRGLRLVQKKKIIKFFQNCMLIFIILFIYSLRICFCYIKMKRCVHICCLSLIFVHT
uniref:Uncharacterized protein n=1 Tax=Periophthalmus magnuspinnatus TaxID=409849 RepID=A0A3B4B1P5_9GOBI